MLVKSAARCKVFLSPHGIKKRVPRKYLAGVCGKGLQKSEFTDSKGLFRLAGSMDDKSVGVYERIAYAERAVSVCRTRRDV